VRFAPGPEAPRQARDFLALACTEWHAEGAARDGGLVVSELVTNAVLHAGTPIDLKLSLSDGHLLIDVRDGVDKLPAIVPPEQRGAGGRGLEIVSRCSRRWGAASDPQGGKHVWALLDA
jgi:anti-sigma regulatory factor (Ser/Thr protein kinase)